MDSRCLLMRFNLRSSIFFISVRLVCPEASAHAHQATASANGDNTHHQLKLLTGSISRYFKPKAKTPISKKYIVSP